MTEREDVKAALTKALVPALEEIVGKAVDAEYARRESAVKTVPPEPKSVVQVAEGVLQVADRAAVDAVISAIGGDPWKAQQWIEDNITYTDKAALVYPDRGNKHMPFARILGQSEIRGDCREFFSATGALLHEKHGATGLMCYPLDPEGGVGHVMYIYPEEGKTLENGRFGLIGVSSATFSPPVLTSVEEVVQDFAALSRWNRTAYGFISLEGDFIYGGEPVDCTISNEKRVDSFDKYGIKFMDTDSLNVTVSRDGFVINTVGRLDIASPQSGYHVKMLHASYSKKSNFFVLRIISRHGFREGRVAFTSDAGLGNFNGLCIEELNFAAPDIETGIKRYRQQDGAFAAKHEALFPLFYECTQLLKIDHYQTASFQLGNQIRG